MPRPLPPSFAVQCAGQDRWFTIAPTNGRPHDRLTLDRRVVSADDCHGLVVPDQPIPIVAGDAVGASPVRLI